MVVYSMKFVEYSDVQKLLTKMGASKRFSKKQKIVIKPNLVSGSPYPVTSDPKFVEQILDYAIKNSKAKIMIAEGSGDDTEKNYKLLGYVEIAKKYGVELIDLNYTDVEIFKNPRAKILKEFYFPKVLKDAYIISVANLKHHHTDAKVTLTLKNMFGIAPGQYYSYNVRGRPWTKETFHDFGVSDCIVDVCTYRLPDMGIIDGRVVQLGAELGGPTKWHGYIYASYDCIELDARCAEILGYTPKDVRYLIGLAEIYERKMEW